MVSMPWDKKVEESIKQEVKEEPKIELIPPKPEILMKQPKMKKEKKIIPVIIKLAGFLILCAPIVMGIGIYLYYKNSGFGVVTYGLIGSMCFALAMMMLVIFLAKKTHAILELKSIISGNPISLFFTDNKRVVWKSIKPENEMISDKNFGTFLTNKNANYIDPKTKNIIMCFNTPLGTSASIESYAIADGLAKVYKDETRLNYIRKILAAGQVEDDKVILRNESGEEIVKLGEWTKIRESIDFSHLKSLLNSITPHSISSSIEMKVAQRVQSLGNTNIKQLLLIFLAVLGAGGLLYMVIMSVQHGNTTVVQSAGTVAKTAAAATLGG